MAFVLTLYLVSLSVSVGSCAGFRTEKMPPDQEQTAPMGPSIEAAQEQLTDRVMSLPGVVGTGISECEGVPCITVFVAGRTPELDRIPSTFEGFQVVMKETGEIRARSLDSP